ncbi:hypothetical protein MCAP1_002225 [Malassezia caprae]|uniref:Uncharacterized protein n=1 Tax=Malassezia caprae TaxID=1381934 RepID=A0AAF0EBI7_9BASI|nr:hypothetical protein MCAP1_002225 [Malassezia caprae]
MAVATPKGPSTLVILRKCHRFLHAKLRELAAEVQVLHRLWYKGAAQFRHMVWWRPVRRVKVLAARITTGSLAQSVPRARGDAPPTRRSAEEVVGVRTLRRLADAYASHWGDARVSWSSHLQGHLQTPPAPMHAPVSLAVMAVCARIARLSREMRRGEDGATGSLAHLAQVGG